jgi:cytochrome c-type biogenesis protein CcmH
VVLLIGIVATIALVRKWKLRTVEMPAVPTTTAFQAARERIRKETEF